MCLNSINKPIKILIQSFISSYVIIVIYVVIMCSLSLFPNDNVRAANQYAFGVFSTISRYQIRQYDFVGFVTLLLIF